MQHHQIWSYLSYRHAAGAGANWSTLAACSQHTDFYQPLSTDQSVYRCLHGLSHGNCVAWPSQFKYWGSWLLLGFLGHWHMHINHICLG
jgi:hypothetical protein